MKVSGPNADEHAATLLSLDSWLSRAEICHYADSTQRITSFHRTVTVRRGGKEQSILLPSSWLDLFGSLRLLRRALRLDKCNVVPVAPDGRDLVIIRGGKVYRYDSRQKSLTKTLTLKNCRNVLHQSVCVTDDGNTLVFGEYGSNRERKEVPVYRSIDAGRTWEKVFAFPPGKIKHVHGCFRDPIDGRIWILTGDFANENFIVVAEPDFANVTWLGDGSQVWRACNLFFEKDRVVWIMDSQLEASRVVTYDRASGHIELGAEFPGPVWYSKHLTDGKFVAATACEVGPGVKDEFCHIFVSDDLTRWVEVDRFAHDNWPKRFFKFGVIGFADGKQSSDHFYLFAEAVRGMDGRVVECSLRPQPK